MPDPHDRRRSRQDLVDRLILEYAGAVPAGQVLAIVVRTERLLQSCHAEGSRGHVLCEELVRHRLAEHTARQPGPTFALSS